MKNLKAHNPITLNSYKSYIKKAEQSITTPTAMADSKIKLDFLSEVKDK